MKIALTFEKKFPVACREGIFATPPLGFPLLNSLNNVFDEESKAYSWSQFIVPIHSHLHVIRPRGCGDLRYLRVSLRFSCTTADMGRLSIKRMNFSSTSTPEFSTLLRKLAYSQSRQRGYKLYSRSLVSSQGLT